jgi:hypothetical protein
VRDLFAHRFVLRTTDGCVLADLTPEGAERIQLLVGDEITIEGEKKPSEIKVRRIERGGEVVDLSEEPSRRGKTSDKIKAGDASLGEDAASATRIVTEAGLTPIGKPRRKHKHFEILGREAGGNLVEWHIDRDGTIGKKKLVESDSDKWSDEIKDEP